MAVSANRLELLQIAEAVAREKSIDKRDRDHGDGGRDREGRALALWRGDRRARRDQRRRPASFGSRATARGRERSRTRRPQIEPRRRAAAQSGGPGRRHHRRRAAAARIRPHRGAIGQAGDRAESARGRARPPVPGIQGPHRRDRQRRRQARRIRQRGRRSRPRRSHRAARRAAAARDLPQRRPRPRLCLRRAAASRADRRSSCRARIRNSWRSCSRRKCRRSTTASSRSRRSPAIPARAPRSR